MALALTLAYTPHRPEPPQHAFLYLDELGVMEALYGGAAGGGKTDTLLMGALRYVHVPGYSALLLRRTYGELEQADGILTRAHEWLAGTDAVYNATHRYTWPNGARLDFGYLDKANDHLRYQGGAWQFIGFDELTQFREAQYRYLLSRLRRPSGIAGDAALSRVPLRMRAASNPGGPGHEWVLRRFIERIPDPDDPDDTPEQAQRRIFIPASLDDNPHLDRDAYRRSLAGLDRVTRLQLLNGDWYVDTGDTVYPRSAVSAAISLGDELDDLAAAGKLAAPAGPITLDVDFGEHNHCLLCYPLANGGLYVVAGEQHDGVELGQATASMLALADELPAWPNRPPRRDTLLYVGEVRYDPGSAGAQSIRTFRRIARARHPRLRTTAVPFGDYKRETINYLRYLMENSEAIIDGELDRDRIGYLAIGRRAPELRKQLRGYIKDPKRKETGDPLKVDDHGPDALVCAASEDARRNRDRGEQERQRAHARANAINNRLPAA